MKTTLFLTLILIYSSQELAAKEHSIPKTTAGLEVKTLEGKTSSFRQQLKKDRWNIVFVWTTYCNHCVDQYPFLSQLHDNKSNNAAVIGVCLDKESSLKKIKSSRIEKNHSFPSVIADSVTFSEAYEINTGEPFTGTPTYLLYYGYKFQAFLDGPTNKETITDFIN